uniref:Leucyl-tRNA synthetase n=1 Tax=viral metagenome TaxID=1070528 RepID=A0A6C0C6N5_9ZZZZ
MDVLIKNEKQIQETWKKNQSTIAVVDNEKKKCFLTFPFPYQNGALHLGHAYTISKVEFYARFKKITGYNVLFPYGFHGTGMPIVASAVKLRETLDMCNINDIDSLPVGNQLRILHEMKIPIEEIPAFTDPQTWLKYFPQRSITDLQKFGAHIDFRRSFITTSINPHYDCFVKWQFVTLNKKGYLKFDKKPVIYSPKDKQICGDHDRNEGEYVGITKYDVYFAHNHIYTLMMTTATNFTEELNIFEWDNKKCISTITFLNNFKYQTNKSVSNVEIIKKDELKDVEFDFYGAKIKIFDVIDFSNAKSESDYYEPTDTVISRTDEKCVVAIIDNWYIDYSAPELKERINDYATSDYFRTPQDRQIFVDASNSLQTHACSKTGNIPGTKLLDTDYVIDSLSDSTIYMAYYTIAHRITELPVEVLQKCYFEVYEFVFMDGVMPQIGYDNLLQEMKTEFLYWYAVDLRVSGEDLIDNHMIMCLYNHAMMWDGDEMLPRRFCINGYITLDGKRMSKSKGVFMTLSDAIDKYGADVTRLVLAMAGSGMNDADFSEKNIQLATQRLIDAKKWCKDVIDTILSYKIGMGNTALDVRVKVCVREIKFHYEEMEYQKVVEIIFNKLLAICDDYGNERTHRKIVEYFLLMIYPICPHMVEEIWAYGAELNFAKYC